MKKYYYTIGKRRYGPFSIDELKEKTITPESMMWCEGMDEWKQASDIPEVDDFLKFPPPVPGVNKVSINKAERRNEKRARHQAIDKKNKVFKIIIWIIHGLSFLAMFTLYGLLFDEFSESELVVISFWWIIPFCFSLAGIIAVWSRSRIPWLAALITAGGSFMFMFFFYGSIWSAL